MVDILCQIKSLCLVPAGPDNTEKIAENYYDNQPVRVKITVAGKELQASQEQNNLLHACLELVANGPTPWADMDHAKFACKMGIGFVDRKSFVYTPKGDIVFKPRSFAFNALKGKERLEVMEKAFLWCADQLGMTVEDMVKEAKSNMRNR
jgi:hypothetical protein